MISEKNCPNRLSHKKQARRRLASENPTGFSHAKKAHAAPSVSSSPRVKRITFISRFSGSVQTLPPIFPVSQWHLRRSLPLQLRDSTGFSPVSLSHERLMKLFCKQGDKPPIKTFLYYIWKDSPLQYEYPYGYIQIRRSCSNSLHSLQHKEKRVIFIFRFW